MTEAPNIHFGLQQIVFAADYPQLDQLAQEAVEGRPATARPYGGIDRMSHVRWSTDTRFWGLPSGYKA